MTPMEAFYSNKNILITGATGFLGKVILEKLMREVPSIGKIFVFVRAKKGEKPADRVNKTIIGSQIFDRLRSERPGFDDWIRTRIVTVDGDLTATKLGLGEEEVKRIKEEIEIVIHCAATLDFDEPFDQALQHNVEATLELFNLSKSFKKLQVFTHMSTAYVSGNTMGKCKESLALLRDASADVEKILNTFRRMTPADLRKVGPSICRYNKYPNTYTYTKCLTEHLLVKSRENVPLVIMRPTIIGASWKEPIEGWTDQALAAAALYLSAGVGFLKFFPGKMDMIGDQIPVDIVSNATLIATYLNAKKDSVTYCHVGSSARNPVSWNMCRDSVVPYWLAFPPEKAIAKIEFRAVSNMASYYFQHLFLFQLPIELFNLYAKFTSNEITKKKAVLMKKMATQQNKKVKQLTHFTTHEWFFEDGTIQSMMNHVTKEDRDRFQCDVALVEWDKYLRAFCWGLATFVLKEKNRPHPSTLQIDWESLPTSRTGWFITSKL